MRERLPRLRMRHVGAVGVGVFAEESIGEGRIVVEFLGEILSAEQLTDQEHSLQVAPGLFLSPSNELDDFVNHSCDPNTGVREIGGRFFLVALRGILTDEEISFDYATTQSGGHFGFTCQCGAASCRKWISDFADLPIDLQLHYRQRDAVLPYLWRDFPGNTADRAASQ